MAQHDCPLSPPDCAARFDLQPSRADGIARTQLRRTPVARASTSAWRALTERAAPTARRTLVACSGGADSVALALALRSSNERGIGEDLVLGHVIHTVRPRAEALADRDLVRRLADRLRVAFVETDLADEPMRADDPKNAEAAARRRRYRALAAMASNSGCGFVATAHHADDQVETILMAVMRGSGSGGLRGLARSRVLVRPSDGGRGVTLIRPMLAATRRQARDLCEAAGERWTEDRTNLDLSLLRNALRHRVLPILEELRPGTARRAARGADNVRAAHALLERHARHVLRRAEIPLPDVERRGFAGAGDDAAILGPAVPWDRSALRASPAAVLAHALRTAFVGLTAGRGADRLPARSVDAVVRAVHAASGEAKRFEWPHGVLVRVERGTVTMTGS